MVSAACAWLLVAFLGDAGVMPLWAQQTVKSAPQWTGPAETNRSLLLPVKDESEKWGYINLKGNWVVPPKYSRAGSFQPGAYLYFPPVWNDRLAVVGLEKWPGKCGYIDWSGKVAIPLEYYDCGNFSEGLAAVRFSNSAVAAQHGVINEQGETVIAPRFFGIGEFSGGLAPAQLSENSKWGYINTKGDWVIPPRFETCGSFSEGLAPVGHPCGYIDMRGNMVIKPQFEECHPFVGGTAIIAKWTGWGQFLTSTAIGRFIVKMVPTDKDDFPTWHPTPYWGFIKRDGTWQVRPDFKFLGTMSSGLAPAENENGYGYISINGQFVIGPKFERAGMFRDGYASVLGGDPAKWNVIDLSGRIVLKTDYPKASWVWNLGNGIFRADLFRAEGIKEVYFDKNGRAIWPNPQ